MRCVGFDNWDQRRLAELIELRKRRKAKEGIDVVKLNKGNAKKKRPRDESEVGRLKKGAGTHDDEEWVFFKKNDSCFLSS